jgi:Trp operon repressor
MADDFAIILKGYYKYCLAEPENNHLSQLVELVPEEFEQEFAKKIIDLMISRAEKDPSFRSEVHQNIIDELERNERFAQDYPHLSE